MLESVAFVYLCQKMTIVKLFKVQQATQEPAAVFDDGEFFIGRNQVLFNV